MPEIVLLIVGLAVAAAVVLSPLRAAATAPADDPREAARIRHRAALEALRDVEADHRAGSLAPTAYASELAAAEAEAAASRAALDEPIGPSPRPSASSARRHRATALAAAAVIGLVLVGGSLLDGTGLANATVVNQPLADARATESARQARITELLAAIAADPADPDALSELADAYLAGPNDDLPRAAAALQLLINADPARPDAYERLMTAYLRAGDYRNGRAVHDAYVALDGADPAEAAFFDGLIALRGENDPARARSAFERFLELAPDDPRVPMIEGLRDEAAESAGG